MAWQTAWKVRGKVSEAVEGAIEIQLSRGYVALVSPEDAEIDDGAWHLYGHNAAGHDNSKPEYHGRKTIAMHRLVVERMTGEPIPAGMEVDHINRNVLDNRRCNLRLATRAMNNQNRRGWGKLGKGVALDKKNGKYTASIRIGTYDTPEEAQAAWEEASVLLRGMA